MFECERMTPLGVPVEPLVYMMMAVSSGLGLLSDSLED